MVGDKAITEVTQDDGIDYSEWWRERVAESSLTYSRAIQANDFEIGFRVSRVDSPGLGGTKR